MRTGRPPDASDAEILAYIANEPFVFSTEIEEEFDYSPNSSGAYKRLEDLSRKGYLNEKRSGNAKAYWISEAGEKHIEEQTS